MIVAKFGGSSLADAAQFRKVKEIVEMNHERKYIVPSAPGKRGPGDDKITDLLYAAHRAASEGKAFRHLLERIQARYEEIADELQIDMDFGKEFAVIEENLKKGATPDYAASRGEYLNGRLLARYLEMPFVDAAEVVRFSADGRLKEEETNTLIGDRLATLRRAVIPGFYGAEEDGTVRTFSRGGSDVSGALVARAVNADIYENWTDVTGFRMADPRIVPDAQYIATITLLPGARNLAPEPSVEESILISILPPDVDSFRRPVFVPFCTVPYTLVSVCPFGAVAPEVLAVVACPVTVCTAPAEATLEACQYASLPRYTDRESSVPCIITRHLLKSVFGSSFTCICPPDVLI